MNDMVKQNAELATDIGITDEISWTGSEDMTFDDYQRIGRTFQQIKSSLAYWIGDWLNFGEYKFGEMAMQAIEDTGKSMETLLKFKAVAHRVPREIRIHSPSWTHSFYVAYTPEPQRGLLLQLAINVGLSSRELKDVVKLEDERRADLLVAYQNHLDEQGPMTHEIFMRLLSDFRLGRIDKPQRDEDEDDNEDEIEDDGDEVGSGPSAEEATLDDVRDFWENVGVPVQISTSYMAYWEGGMAVRAGIDSKGKPHLVWERTDDDE